MKQNKRYSIGEIADAASVSRRTIRFYVQSEVIPPPVGLGRYCYYTEEHLDAIRRHRLKKVEEQAFLSLGKIPRYETEPAMPSQIVIRFMLGEGAVLELPEGSDLPDPQQTKVLMEIIKKLITPRRER